MRAWQRRHRSTCSTHRFVAVRFGGRPHRFWSRRRRRWISSGFPSICRCGRFFWRIAESRRRWWCASTQDRHNVADPLDGRPDRLQLSTRCIRVRLDVFIGRRWPPFCELFGNRTAPFWHIVLVLEHEGRELPSALWHQGPMGKEAVSRSQQRCQFKRRGCMVGVARRMAPQSPLRWRRGC